MPDFSSDYLRLLLTEQRQNFKLLPDKTRRSLLPQLDKGFNLQPIQMITGLRRVGKSTLLSQWAKEHQNWHYINFEDERLLGFSVNQFEQLNQQLITINPNPSAYLFDEIQNVERWELFVRRLQEQGHRIIITGSNASLLSQELGTRLTGRYLSHHLYPFSFKEYLKFQRLTISLPVTLTELATFNHHLHKYLTDGGVPLFLTSNDTKVVSQLLQDIIYRDIVARFKIEAVKSLTDLINVLLTTPGQLISYTRLKSVLNLGSTNTVINFVDDIASAWLIGVLPRFACSRKTQIVNQKKIYPIDTKFTHLMQVGQQRNTGRLLEMLVYWSLRQRYEQIFYYKTNTNQEVDFYIPTENLLIQVTEDLYSKEVIDREVEALYQAHQELHHPPTKLLLCLTPPPEKFEGVTIKPLVEWLMS